jgi:twitching motility protein PilT
MQTFDQSLYRLYREDLISFEEALRQATNPDEFKLRVAGIHSTSDVSTEQMDQAASNKGSPLDPQHPDSPFEFSRS